MAKRRNTHRVTVRKPAPSGISLTDEPPETAGPGTSAINPKGRKGRRDLERRVMQAAASATAPQHADQMLGGKMTRQVARQALRLEAKRKRTEANRGATLKSGGRRRKKGKRK